MTGDAILMGLVMLLVAAASGAVGYCAGVKDRIDATMEEMLQAYEEDLAGRIARQIGEVTQDEEG